MIDIYFPDKYYSDDDLNFKTFEIRSFSILIFMASLEALLRLDSM